MLKILQRLAIGAAGITADPGEHQTETETETATATPTARHAHGKLHRGLVQLLALHGAWEITFLLMQKATD